MRALERMGTRRVDSATCAFIPSLNEKRAARSRPPATVADQRRCPRPIPRIPAFRRSARSVRLIFFAITGSGVRTFECAFSSRTSSFVHGVL